MKVLKCEDFEESLLRRQEYEEDKIPPPLSPLLAVRPPPLRGGGSVALKVGAAEVVPERGQIVPGEKN